MFPTIIILAAGASRRMGRSKQLLLYRGSTLLQRALDTATAFSDSVVLVLGANSDEIIPAIDPTHARVIINQQWQEGMASSIREGLSAALAMDASTEHIIIMTADQPYVGTELLMDLLEAREGTGQPIIATEYDDSLGIPVLFHRSLFPTLLELQGDTGAKTILMNNKSLVATCPYPLAAIDVDTPEDFDSLH